jgi:hypothetical protein
MCFCTSSSIPIPVSMILNSRTIGLFSTASEFLVRGEVESGDRPSRKKEELSSLLVLIPPEVPSIGCSGVWKEVSREEEDEEGEVEEGEVEGGEEEDEDEGRDKVLWTMEGGGLT